MKLSQYSTNNKQHNHFILFLKDHVALKTGVMA